MSAAVPLEQKILAGAEAHLDRACPPGDEAYAARLEILEAAASRLGGFDLAAYHRLARRRTILALPRALAAADGLVDELRRTSIHPSLALSSLARPPLHTSAARSTGAYYTDFRLARMVAGRLPAGPRRAMIDPASGTGILLVAAALRICGADPRARAEFIRHAVHAADLSADALRGAALALASLTDDLDAIGRMLPRLRAMDSILAGVAGWADLAPGGFPTVVGNPPWEKLKVNRHEFMAAGGHARHYGDDYALADEGAHGLHRARAEISGYATEAALDLDLQGSGEPDLYKLFLELSCRLAAPGGHVALLLPAGLIRSQGTEDLRRFLIGSAPRLDLTVLDNRARFFAIDTRFKFLAVHAVMGPAARREPIVLRHRGGTDDGVAAGGEVRLGRAPLHAVRPDLSIPEVRTQREWGVFQRMTEAGGRFGDPDGPWKPSISREVDMSRDRTHFSRAPGEGLLPLVEGRMVHQHRFGAKTYVSGTGRRALWAPGAPGREEVRPQFWIGEERLRGEVRARTRRERFGFCDVTGQTNERSLLASRIPAGVVCGNKVPTIVFGGEGAPAGRHGALGYLWLALANSFAVDWYLRRILTTSLNYFILLSLPLPVLDADGPAARRLETLARQLALPRVAGNAWAAAVRRAEVDARVLAAFGLDLHDAALILDDFPLLDRGQPPLHGERRSTLTRDLVLMHTARLMDAPSAVWEKRVRAARTLGAAPFIPSEFAAAGVPDAEEEAELG